MRADLLYLAAALAQRGEPFAFATVVRREPPSSARAGDSALITRGGDFHGWLGGSCTRPAVIHEATQAIRDGMPRLIALRVDPDVGVPSGVAVLPMTCHSGGSVDVYIQPVLPAPRLLVFGVSPAARAVARFGKVMGYAVEAIDPEADATTFPEVDHVVTDLQSSELADRAERDPTRLYAVIATLGINDEGALSRALAFSPAYLGLIASKKRFAEISAQLAGRGIAADTIESISCPAGLDIGAIAPEEIALSVMAEIVQRVYADSHSAVPMPDAVQGFDPVCGMAVDLATARHRATVSGHTYAFCCGGCRERFVAAPDEFLPRTAEKPQS